MKVMFWTLHGIKDDSNWLVLEIFWNHLWYYLLLWIYFFLPCFMNDKKSSWKYRSFTNDVKYEHFLRIFMIFLNQMLSDFENIYKEMEDGNFFLQINTKLKLLENDFPIHASMHSNRTLVIQMHHSLMFHYQNTMISIYFFSFFIFRLNQFFAGFRERESKLASNFGGSWKIFLDVKTTRNPDMWTSSYVLCVQIDQIHCTLQYKNSIPIRTSKAVVVRLWDVNWKSFWVCISIRIDLKEAIFFCSSFVC